MGFWETVLGRGVAQRFFTPRVEYINPTPDTADVASWVAGLSPSKLWRTQPHLRTVVGFRARNVAQLGLHVYRREADGSRVRDRDSDLAKALGWMDGRTTPYEAKYSLVGDLDLYDRAFWLVLKTDDNPTGWEIRRIPPSIASPVRDRHGRIESWDMLIDGSIRRFPRDVVMYFRGFDPTSVDGCSPTVESLKTIIEEQIESSRFRTDIWKRGGRVSSVLQRPLDAPEWSAEAREAFREDWYAKYTGNGQMAGGTPILEDGMTLTRVDFSAADQQFVEAARLSLETVAAAFFVEPTMVGMGGGATYSNLRAFRKMLYTETLGPLLTQIEDRINHFLVPMIMGERAGDYYVEFNIAEKLQGDFEEQAAVLSAATGRPWMTANEARARQNMPFLPDGDQLVVPLNVLLGGQASPRDSGSQNEVPDSVEEDRPKTLGVKSRPSKPTVDKHAEVLADFFARQGRVVRSRLGAKADWWDEERWDGELTDDLVKLARMTSVNAARRSMVAAGLDPDDYDVDRTMAFLREASRRNAKRINAATRRQLDDLDEFDDESVAHVFDVAVESRAPQGAFVLAGFAAGFGTVEAARQQSSGATKTWVVNSSNPRASHAAMDGETVGIDEDFSAGIPWPGAGADVDEVAGCTCSVVVHIP